MNKGNDIYDLFYSNNSHIMAGMHLHLRRHQLSELGSTISIAGGQHLQDNKLCNTKRLTCKQPYRDVGDQRQHKPKEIPS